MTILVTEGAEFIGANFVLDWGKKFKTQNEVRVTRHWIQGSFDSLISYNDTSRTTL
jgi:hypothetical protein